MSGKIILKETSREECASVYDVIWDDIENGGVLKDFLADLEAHISKDTNTSGSIRIIETDGADNERPRAVASLTYSNGSSINDLDTIPENIRNSRVIKARAYGYENEMNYCVKVMP